MLVIFWGGKASHRSRTPSSTTRRCWTTPVDDECTLLTVGAWYHMTGYGIAFPRGSKHTSHFNEKLMSYKDNEAEQKSIGTLGIGAVLIGLSAALLRGAAGPHLAVTRAHLLQVRQETLPRRTPGDVVPLLVWEVSMGKSLTFRGAVFEAQNKLRRHRCRDPLCDTHIWKVKHELDMARVKIKQLEKELESHGVKPSRKFAAR
ncbi:putative Glutamate receptor ionotropic, NMDA 2A-like 3 [Homarus americanus]|uniref:Putative Glutamate receptor ionotropic, NMDA 2A-like 3 n=1 Tax=Homarus americanus TaxID=6706 RepID=A0A8J5NBR7_HOMAM|nr:putative Glutamate receptor ionotropic, NMDA 2A-like 3 [Homarus americanus]